MEIDSFADNCTESVCIEIEASYCHMNIVSLYTLFAMLFMMSIRPIVYMGDNICGYCLTLD